MNKTFELEIVTPINTITYEDINYLRAPSANGLFGVLCGHIESVIALDIGEIKVTTDDKIIRYSTSGGFADIDKDKVLLVLETVEPKEDIDIKRAEESLEKYLKLLKDGTSNIEKAKKSIKKAKNRISISKKS